MGVDSQLLSVFRDKNQEEFIYAAYIICDYQTNRCAWYRKWWHECRRHECWINSYITRLMSLIIVSSTDFEDTSTQTKPWSLKSSICQKNFKFAADIVLQLLFNPNWVSLPNTVNYSYFRSIDFIKEHTELHECDIGNYSSVLITMGG